MKTENYLLSQFGFIALLFLVSFGAFGQPSLEPGWTWQNPQPTNQDLKDVQFLDPQNIWAMGEVGTILKSTDGGQNWIHQGFGIAQDLNSFHFINSQTGWAVGNSGTIIKTSNGGQNWTIQLSGTIQPLLSIQFIDAQTGWAVGHNGTIIKTSNGGQNWIAQASGTTQNFTSVNFPDSQTGWVVSKNGSILKTSNGGRNWFSQNNNSLAIYHSVHFTDPLTGWAAGSGTLLKTTNGGQSWVPRSTGSSAQYYSVYFIDSQTGWLAGFGGKVFKTTNGGQNWTSQNSGTSETISSVHFTDAQNGIFVGESGTIFISSNGGQNWIKLSKGSRRLLHSVHFTNQLTGWAVGDGTILKTNTGGQTWTAQIIGGSETFNSVYFVDTQTGWAVGNGIILKTTNGGQNWSVQSAGGLESFNSVYFADSQTGWAVGASGFNGIIHKTTNGGQSWSSQINGIDDTLFSVHFIDSQTGWAVGGSHWLSSVILKTTNGGQDWINHPIGAGILFSVKFTDSQTGWAVGQNGTIIKTSDGGLNWNSQASGSTNHLYSVFFPGAQTGWAVGESGVMIKTTNSGQTWVNQHRETTEHLFCVHFADSLHGWSVGESGTILTSNPISSGLPTSQITGNLYQKNNSNCFTTPIPVSNQLVKVLPGLYYAISDNMGKYNLKLPVPDSSTSITLKAKDLENPAFQASVVCPPSLLYNITLDTIPATLSGKDFGFEITPCHNMVVQIGSNRRRLCFKNFTSLSYHNQGSLSAPDAFILVEFPQWVRPLSSSQPYLALNDSVWRFNLGQVPAGGSGSFIITDSVLCGNVGFLGINQCTKATIYPAPDCPSVNWSGASLSAFGKCMGNGMVRLSLANLGTGDMLDSTSYRIYLDSNLVFQKRVKLNQNDSLILQVVANGKNVRLEADQVPNHPTQYSVVLNAEGCGLPGQSISKGFIIKFPVAQSPNSKANCLPIIGAYDPNDKQAFPQGFTNQNIVPPNTRMEYLVRFQNTGTDTAFTVFVIDTLDQNLNVESFEMGAASHPYQLSMQTVKSGKTFLRWQFNNILLPDSNVNQLKSNGFIQYRISPKPGLALGSQVRNHAEIYFDFNPPVVTNQTLSTFNTITYTDPSLNNSVQIITALAGKLSPKQIGVNLYPNPVTEHSLTADFSTKGNLFLFNAQGQQVFEKENIEGKQVLPIHLKSGFYLAQLKTAKGVSVVKVVVE